MTSARLASASLPLTLALACGGGPAATTASAPSSTGDDPQVTTTGDAPTSTGAIPDASTGTSAGASTTTDATTGTSDDPGVTSDATTGASTTDATTGTTGAPSTGEQTAGTSTGDTTQADSSTGEPDGLGVLSGECGLLDAMELDSPEPFVVSNAIDFGALGFDYDLLTEGGKQVHDEGNLNAGSLHSEIVAHEVLARCEGAVLLATEGAVAYVDPMGKKTDLLVELDGLKIGVSVVRAVGFPKDDPYTVAQAETILTKKLGDIQASSANVAPEDAWVKQILHVVAYAPMHRESVLAAYAALDPALRGDTVLVVSVTDGEDAFIY